MTTVDLPLLVKLRQGKQRDMEDPRSSPLSHLSDLLPSLPSLKFLLLENVAGFETSKARDQVCESVLSFFNKKYHSCTLCMHQDDDIKVKLYENSTR